MVPESGAIYGGEAPALHYLSVHFHYCSTLDRPSGAWLVERLSLMTSGMSFYTWLNPWTSLQSLVTQVAKGGPLSGFFQITVKKDL